jgi:hypothetical protein
MVWVMADASEAATARVRVVRARSRATLALGLLLGLAGALSSGCSPGVQWRGLIFEPVHADARRDNKLTFVYFRHWAVMACTDFEENVLKSPAVLEALRPDGAFYCAVLDAYADRRLASDWGIEAPPGVVILDPTGRVLARLAGKITAEQLLAAMTGAIDAFPAATQPARAP